MIAKQAKREKIAPELQIERKPEALYSPCQQCGAQAAWRLHCQPIIVCSRCGHSEYSRMWATNSPLSVALNTIFYVAMEMRGHPDEEEEVEP